MALDRDATIRHAEKLLRQGKPDGAIAEYVRLVQDHPRDWTLANTLGDLYTRTGDRERAVAQFTRAADGMFADGFLPKAAALYKKALRVSPDHEHTLLQLSEIAARQGLLTDARGYLRQLERQRQARHDSRGIAECAVRLALLDDADVAARLAGARAAQTLGDAAQAVALFRNASDDLAEAGRQSEAIDALFDAVALDSANLDLQRHLVRKCLASGQPERAVPLLTHESAGSDPELLLALSRRELIADRDADARAALTRLLGVAPQRTAAVLALAGEFADAGDLDRGFTCTGVVVDDALLARDWNRAVDVLQRFVQYTTHVPALVKLVELAAEAGRADLLDQGQAQLADAYLASGRAAEARAIAEDLVARHPGVKVYADRLRRSLVALGVADPDRVVARTRVDVPAFGGSPAGEQGAGRSAVALDDQQAAGEHVEQDGSRGASEDEPIVLDMLEIDLDEALAGLDRVEATPAPAEPVKQPVHRPRDLDDIFEELRARAASSQARGDGTEPYERGLQHLEHGRLADALVDLKAAARMPLYRFRASARLGRLSVAQGDIAEGIDWLERAAEAPAPSPEAGWALLYDLASALERIGEAARALAVLMEIQTDAGAYRDVRERIDRLARTGQA